MVGTITRKTKKEGQNEIQRPHPPFKKIK